jgi:hypothetical protein
VTWTLSQRVSSVAASGPATNRTVINRIVDVLFIVLPPFPLKHMNVFLCSVLTGIGGERFAN